jgi:hypothetical protein
MSNTTPEIFNAWFSHTQKQNAHMRADANKKRPISNIYLTENGKEIEVTEVEIEVTEVSTKMNTHGERFSDSIYLGKVVKWVRSVYK